MSADVPPIYVVSTPARRDRRTRLRAALADWPRPVVFNTDLGLAVDAGDLALDEIDGLSLFPWRLEETDNRWWARELKLGEVACSLAHDALWQRIATGPDERAIILEDDADPRPGLAGLVRLRSAEADTVAPGWDVLYLGRRRWGADSEIAGSDDLVTPGFSACLYAYLVTRSAALRLVEAGITSTMMPVDDFVPALMGVHPRTDVSAALAPVLRPLALRTDVVGVLPTETWGSGTEETRFLDRTEVDRFTRRSHRGP